MNGLLEVFFYINIIPTQVWIPANERCLGNDKYRLDYYSRKYCHTEIHSDFIILVILRYQENVPTDYA